MAISFVTEPTQFNFQRSSKTGGAYGVGINDTDCLFNVTFTGSVGEYALVDYDRDSDVIGSLETEYAAFASGVDFTVPVSAKAGWYKLAVREDGGAPSYSTSFFGCGGNILGIGQSIMSNMGFNSSGTLASIGLVPSPNSSGLFDRNGTYSWDRVGDGYQVSSAYAARYLKEKEAQEGCNFAFLGYARFGIAQVTLLPRNNSWPAILAVLNEAKGWEVFYYHQGHDDASRGTSSTSFAAGLHTILDAVQAQNSYPNPDEFISTVINLNTTYNSATTERLNNIRISARRVAQQRGATHFEMPDIELQDDNIHPAQAGCNRIAEHHLRHEYGNPNNPTVTGYTKTGTTVTVAFSAPVVEVGDATNYVDVALATDPYTPLSKLSVTVNEGAGTADVVLSSDPGNVELVPLIATQQNLDGTAYITDTYADSFSSIGRPLGPTMQDNAQLESNRDLTEELGGGTLTYNEDGVSATGGARLRSESLGGLIPTFGPHTIEFDLLTTVRQTFNYVYSMQSGYEFLYDVNGNIIARTVNASGLTVGPHERYAIQFDGISVSRIFRDGVQIAENLSAVPRERTESLHYLLAAAAGGSGHEGFLRNLAVYRTDRYTAAGYTPAEIDPTDPYLWAYYPLTEGPQAGEIPVNSGLRSTERTLGVTGGTLSLNSVNYTDPTFVSLGARGGLSAEINGRYVAELDAVSGNLTIDGGDPITPPAVIYVAPDGSLTDTPNGRPIARIK